MPKQFHVQLFEAPTDGEAFPARELLPWADPYIAQLMGQLQEEEETWDFESKDEEFEEEEFIDDELPEDTHLDSESHLPPVYGGWPLLNDLPAYSQQNTAESRHEVA